MDTCQVGRAGTARLQAYLSGQEGGIFPRSPLKLIDLSFDLVGKRVFMDHVAVDHSSTRRTRHSEEAQCLICAEWRHWHDVVAQRHFELACEYSMMIMCIVPLCVRHLHVHISCSGLIDQPCN